MMQAIRRQLSFVFAIQAAALCLIGALGMVTLLRGQFSSSVWLAVLVGPGFVVASIVNGTAWWSTRKQSPFRNVWAMLASGLSVAMSVMNAALDHFRLNLNSPLSLELIFGVAGLVVFARGGTASKSVAADPSKQIAPTPSTTRPLKTYGDRTVSWLPFRVVVWMALIAEIWCLQLWWAWGRHRDLDVAHGIALYLLLLGVQVSVVFVHECGHALPALMFGMSLTSFKAGPLQCVRRKARWTVKFNPAGFFDLGGSVGAVQTNPGQPGWQLLTMIAGGPLANIALGLACLWAVRFDHWIAYEQTWYFLGVTASSSLIVGIANFFPVMTDNARYTDGARILQRLTRSPMNLYFRAMDSLMATSLTSLRYRDLDAEIFERAAAMFPNDLRGLYLYLYASEIHQDAGRAAEARATLAAAERIYDGQSIELPRIFHTIFIINHALLNRDAATTRLWWNRMEMKEPDPEKTESDKIDYVMAETALFWMEGSISAAERCLQKAEAKGRLLPLFGADEYDRYRCTLLGLELSRARLADFPADESIEQTNLLAVT